MWSTRRKTENQKIIVLADSGYLERENQRKGSRKLSCIMAMILGMILTLEIMVGGAMLFHIDLHAADGIALILSFVVLYSGVVAILTDK